MERKNRKEIAGIGETNSEGEATKVNAEDFIEEGAGQSEEGGGGKAQRTNRKAAGARKKQDKNALNLGEAIYAIHEFLSFMTQIEELKITKEQSEALSTSIDNLDLELQTKISKKTIAIIQLAVVASSIYIPKIILIKDKIKNKKNKNEVS